MVYFLSTLAILCINSIYFPIELLEPMLNEQESPTEADSPAFWGGGRSRVPPFSAVGLGKFWSNHGFNPPFEVKFTHQLRMVVFLVFSH